MTTLQNSDAAGVAKHHSPDFAEAAQARLHSIDIWRALAALAVVLFHARAVFSVGTAQVWHDYGLHTLRPDIWLSYAMLPFSLGWMGVPIFFILSGYCIHRGFAFALAKSQTATLDVGNFYWRRIWRIYPVYIGAMLLTFAVDTLGDPAAFEGWAETLKSFGLNLLMLQGLFVSPFGSNGVFWTLSIEFHLYLFYPVIFLLSRRYGARWTLCFTAVVSVITAIIYTALHLDTVFEHGGNGSPIFFNHLFLWTAGAYLADIEAGRAKAPKGIFWHLIWVAALVAGIWLRQRGILGWWPVPLAIGCMGLVQTGTPLIRYLCRNGGAIARAFYYIGLVSYSLYATHVPVFGALEALTGDYKSYSVLWPLGGSAIAVAWAFLFFYLIERHTIRAPKRRPKPA